MNQPGETHTTEPSRIKSTLSRWLSFKRKRFWVLLVFLLYTISGFLVAPAIIENRLVTLLEQDLGRKARIENIDVNPYVLSLRIQGFELDDTDQVPLASFREFFVNFQLSSLFYWAWTFDEISLDGPFLMFERFDQSDSRMSRLLADFARLKPPEPEASGEDQGDVAMPRLLVHKLGLSDGVIDFKDNVPATMVETRLSPINISVESLNTLPDKTGSQSVTIQLADGASVKWDGSISLSPLESRGELVLNNLHLDPLIAYLRSTMPLQSLSATLSTTFDYHVFMDFGGHPELTISDLSVELGNINANGLTPATEFINIPDILLSGGALQYPEQKLGFEKLSITEPRLLTWLDENRELNLLDIVPEKEDSADSQGSATEARPWSIDIDEIVLLGGRVEFTDNSVKPAAVVDVENLRISLSDFNNRGGSVMPLQLEGMLGQGGSFSVEGVLGILPDASFDARMRTKDIPLRIGQAYAQQLARVEINDGFIDSEIELNFSQANIAVSGAVRVPALEISEQQDHSKLLSWNLLDIDRFEFDRQSNRLSFSQLDLEQLYGVLILDENKVTNISEILIERQGEKGETGDATPMDLVIGGIVIKDSSMDFSDLSLPLPFSTHIIDLDGSISVMDSSSDVPANINLEGQVDEFGLARISGSINVFDPIRHTDVDMKFRNLLMSNLSPYTVQFAGREIDQGKLDLELGYSIEKGMLNGTNDVVLSDLVLGKKVDHPDAASLPLGLAVSLLKDSDGVIEIDLPVEGDINDPEFHIGGVIWQALTGFIGKIVSAPFRLLGNLIGLDSEDLGQFEFLAGRSDLTPPELEKVAQLRQALQQRPELVVEIAGVFDRNIDTVALKRSSLMARAVETLGEDVDTGDEQSMMLDERVRTLVETMFREKFPEADTAAIRAEHTRPAESGGQEAPSVDELAYTKALWDGLLEAETVTDGDLAALASARAQAISDAFTDDGDVFEGRIVITDPTEVKSEDPAWVVLELSVAPE